MATTEHPLAAEYDVLQHRCGLVDRSERGKLLLTGGEAKEFLHGQVTNDIEALVEGTGCYAAFLTHKGKMLGDMRVLDGGAAGLWLDCERGALQELFNMIRRFKLGRVVELQKRTVERALLSLVGPGARRVAGAEDLPEAEHAHRTATIGGAAVRVVATDLGVDVIADAEDAEAVRAALVEAGAEPVSAEAADVLRVESGRPRFGIDLEPEAVIPQEAGLNERAVSFEKGCYVGQETVARLHWRGKPNRHLRGLRLSEPAASGTPLIAADGKQVGVVTSPVVSPALGPIGLGLVRREVEPGGIVRLGAGPATAEVVALPFSM